MGPRMLGRWAKGPFFPGTHVLQGAGLSNVPVHASLGGRLPHPPGFRFPDRRQHFPWAAPQEVTEALTDACPRDDLTWVPLGTMVTAWTLAIPWEALASDAETLFFSRLCYL